MGKNELDELLEQLHERLGAARSLDADDRRRLRTVLHDIEAVLGKPAAAPPTDRGLEAFAAKFEAEHPALADGLRRMADALGKAGI